MIVIEYSYNLLEMVVITNIIDYYDDKRGLRFSIFNEIQTNYDIKIHIFLSTCVVIRKSKLKEKFVNFILKIKDRSFISHYRSQQYEIKTAL